MRQKFTFVSTRSCGYACPWNACSLWCSSKRDSLVIQVDHDHDDRERRTHSVLSILVSVGAREVGKSHLLRDPTLFSFKITAGFWGEYYPATHDPSPVCIVGLGSGIGALLGVAVERIKNDLPTCAAFSMSEIEPAIWNKVNEVSVCTQPWDT